MLYSWKVELVRRNNTNTIHGKKARKIETIIRSPNCSLGPVPDTQNSSLVPVSIIVVWDQIKGGFIWS